MKHFGIIHCSANLLTVVVFVIAIGRDISRQGV